MIESKFKRVEHPDDPRRCQAIAGHTGQCPYEAMPGAEFCHMHNGPTQVRKKEKESGRLYRIAKWQSRINELADGDQAKSLREEIGILRVVLEEILNMCSDAAQLLLYSNKITDTALKIEKLVASCHRLETSTGSTLDKSQTLQLAAVMIEVIGRHVTDQDVLDAISDEIAANILSISRKETKDG